MKLLSVLPFLALLGACSTDPNAHFSPESLTAKERVDFSSAKVILIGEQHDNPVHHEIQKDILETLAKEGRLKSVIFEQVDWNNQGTLDFLSKSNIDSLPKKLDWANSGWPDYDMYRPLFETAVYAKAKVIAGGLPKDRIPLLYKSSYEVAFSAAELERLKLRTPLDSVGQERIAKEIFDGHCQMIPEDHAQKMVPIQRARDGALVKGYLNEADISGVTVFILGNGHARKDFGMPTLLKNIDPKLRVWSVGLLEEGGETPPDGAFDKVWVTEKAEREDPCAKMKNHMDAKEKAQEAVTPDTEEAPAEADKEKAEEPAVKPSPEPNTEAPASEDTADEATEEP